jgi:nicotinate-nucleotide pyrophosphorylase (carboxylating)
VEVESLAQLAQVLPEGPDIVLLDNMPPAELRRAVELRNSLAPQVELEASGGVNLETVAAIAATGVERISVGALTHSAPSLDVALDWQAPAAVPTVG